MRASWSAVLRMCREVAYGIDSATAIRHGRQPGVPPYPPPSLFSVPTVRAIPPARSSSPF